MLFMRSLPHSASFSFSSAWQSEGSTFSPSPPIPKGPLTLHILQDLMLQIWLGSWARKGQFSVRKYLCHKTAVSVRQLAEQASSPRVSLSCVVCPG